MCPDDRREESAASPLALSVARHYKLRLNICFIKSISILAELPVKSNKISKSKPKSNASKAEARTQASKSKPQKYDFSMLIQKVQ